MATVKKNEVHSETDGQDTKTRADKLEVLRSRLFPLLSKPYYQGHLDVSDANLTRWLEAAGESVLLAEARLRASIDTRRHVHLPPLQTCTYTPPHTLRSHMGGGLCGYDRDGCPVYYQLFGITDMLGIVQACSKEQIITFWVAHFEKLNEFVKLTCQERGKPVHNILLIVDMQMCSKDIFRWQVLSAWSQALELHQELCPAIFKEILLIHPPSSLSVLYSFLSSRLSRDTRDKIKVIGDGNMLRHLLIRVEKHQIPAYLGGYKCDIDSNPYCRHEIYWPHKVPRWSHLTNPRSNADVINMEVRAGGTAHEELQIPATGTRVLWQIFDVTHPVVLKIYLPSQLQSKPSRSGHLVENRPIYTTGLKRSNLPQGGAIVANYAGIYHLTLDNSKDMIHTVRAKAKINILPPADFFQRFDKKIPLGELVDFSKPVTNEERARRKEQQEACKECRLADRLKFY